MLWFQCTMSSAILLGDYVTDPRRTTVAVVRNTGREGGREGGKKRGREGGREGGKEGGREGGRKESKSNVRQERGREKGKITSLLYRVKVQRVQDHLVVASYI